MEDTVKSPREKPMEKEESKTEPNVGDALRIPDGGWGWVVCFAGFMINFITVGLISSSGIILLGLIDLYDESMSKTSVVGSLFQGIMMCVGPFVLLLMMFNISHRQVIIYGGFFAAIFTFSSAFAQQIEILYATFGIFTGGFIGISYFAGNTIVGCYFKKKRALAVGLASSGSGAGTFALSYVTERSLFFYGTRGTFILMSGLLLNFLVFGALCRPLTTIRIKKKMTKKEITLKSVKILQSETNLGFESDGNRIENKEHQNTTHADDSEHPGHSENDSPARNTNTLANKLNYLRLAIFDPEVLKNSGMQLLLAVYLFWAMGQIVLMYLPAKAESVGLSREQGAFLMSIYGAVATLSQIIVGILVDILHIPTSYILMFSLLGMSAISVAITFCHSFYLFVICSCFFAIFKGFSTSLRVVLVASVLGVKKLAKGYSPMCILIGLIYMIYPFIAGALYDATQSLDPTFYFCGACLCMSSILSSGIVYKQIKKKFDE